MQAAYRFSTPNECAIAMHSSTGCCFPGTGYNCWQIITIIVPSDLQKLHRSTKSSVQTEVPLATMVFRFVCL